MGRYSEIDWIVFEWDDRRTGVGPVRSSLDDGATMGWYEGLGPWLDPGMESGISLCRIMLNGRVAVLSRDRAPGADSRRTLRVHAYLGGAVHNPSAMPNVRQALALAPGWSRMIPAHREPLDLAHLLESYSEASAEFDRRARSCAGELAPVLSEAMRYPGEPLSVLSEGTTAFQLWGLADVLDQVLGTLPQTFSTYESDDLRPGTDVVFLRQWPGASSRAAKRRRIDPRVLEPEDDYHRMAELVLAAYADDTLGSLLTSLRIKGDLGLDERIRLLHAGLDAYTSPPRFTGQASTSQPPSQAAVPAQEPQSAAMPASAGASASAAVPRQAPARRAPMEETLPQPVPARRSVPPYMFDTCVDDLRAAQSEDEVWAILRDLHEWATTRPQGELRAPLLAHHLLVPELQRHLGPGHVHAALIGLMDLAASPQDPQPPRVRRPERLHLLLVALSIVQVALLLAILVLVLT
ncbi:hypothetical protein ABT294_22230 [Nonomuraea sp. NPDC000554]|uniref:hypothetical protein n=1 Tax=Nonomuraea sp. NPDC000554 TaxID=3154259 RepID=UPI00332671EE